MPKTKDAFALEGFDGARILSRNYFRGYAPPEELHLTDEDYLTSIVLSASDADDSTFSERFAGVNGSEAILTFWGSGAKSAKLAYTMTLANKYQTRLTRHNDKLMEYSASLIGDYDFSDKIQTKIRRAQNLADRYADACRAVQNLQRALFNAIATIEDGNADSVRRRFAERLRQARKKKNMTQQDVANLIHMSAGGYTQYELARRDPSIPTLIKLARILDCSADWLLGLTA